MNKLKIGIYPILAFSMVCCSAKTKWPKEMPASTTINYSESEGMSDYLKEIEFRNDSLFYSEKSRMNNFKPVSWSAKIELSEKQKLYQAFVDNKFDRIKNKENKTITYDVGSERISIDFDTVYYGISYGPNFPLSDADLKRYNAIVSAINGLVGKYAGNQKKQIAGDANLAVILYDSAKHNWIFEEKGSRTELSETEINDVKSIVEKAVKEGNAKPSKHYSNLNLAEYKFQYIPIITNTGEKQVWVNAFCNSDGVDWSKDIVAVDDGGECYWNTIVNLTKKTYRNFMVNGPG